MKICAIICEYNPFHNGHLYHLTEAKRKTGADAVVCLMSGNFVQRGDAAILDKYTRAKHAVQAGADAVIELPTVFATSCAEIFAKGAVKLLAALPDVTHLSFGTERDENVDYFKIAKTLCVEPTCVSEKIRLLTDRGESYVKARESAWKDILGDNFPTSPNDILAVEYAKAALHFQANFELAPVHRVGNDYKQNDLSSTFASATAVRNALFCDMRDAAKAHVPPFVFTNLPENIQNSLAEMEKTALLIKSEEEIEKTLDCSEGLEHALKKAAKDNLSDIVAELTSKRYTAARLKRILLHVLLGIDGDFVKECLNADLYYNVLALKNDASEILSALSRSGLPVLVRGGDIEKLNMVARKCFEKDLFADEIYAVAMHREKLKKQLF